MSEAIHYGNDGRLSACGKKGYRASLNKSEVTCNLCKRTNTYHQDFWKNVKIRRQRVEGCTFCDSQKGDFFPPHDASDSCRSGGYNHCTCDTCF